MVSGELLLGYGPEYTEHFMFITTTLETQLNWREGPGKGVGGAGAAAGCALEAILCTCPQAAKKGRPIDAIINSRPRDLQKRRPSDDHSGVRENRGVSFRRHQNVLFTSLPHPA